MSTGPGSGALHELLSRLAAGDHPASDASVTTLPAPAPARAVVVGGTGWHVVAADVDPGWVAEHVAGDRLAAPLGARFLAALAARTGLEPGGLDVVLVAPDPAAAVPVELVAVTDADHRRLTRARAHRADVQGWTTPDGAGLLTLGRGVAGRWEVGTEVDPAARGRGLGTALAAAAVGLTPAGERLWAQVAAANTASLRAFLAAGWVPTCAEVLFAPSSVQRL